jgi:3-phenylpropionate/cinnamic acid dioxygenase small subunit
VSSCTHCDIAELNGRFARALDLGDVDAWVATFTPHARYDNGRTELHGHAELRAWMARRSASVRPRTTRHVWSGLVIDPAGDRDAADDTDVVTVTSTWVCYAADEVAPVDRVSVWSVADFVDTCVRVDGRWLLAARTIRTVFRDPSLAPSV